MRLHTGDAAQVAARNAWCQDIYDHTSERSTERAAMLLDAATALQISPKQMYAVFKAWRHDGARGVERKERSDSGRRRSLTPRQIDIWIGYAMEPSRQPWPITERVREFRPFYAQSHAGEAPLLCSDMTLERVLLEAHPGLAMTRAERREAYARRLHLTVDYGNQWWQADQRRGDLWVVNEETGELVRPWLFHFVDMFSGMEMGGGYYLHYDTGCLEEALLDSLFPDEARRLPFGGVPENIYWDNGLPHRSQWMARVAERLSIHLEFSKKAAPRSHGFIEQTHNTAAVFEMKQPRYCGADNRADEKSLQMRLIEDGELSPSEVRPLTLSELNAEWKKWLATDLLHRSYRGRESRCSLWLSTPAARRAVPNPGWLARLFRHREFRNVRDGGFDFKTVRYVAEHLGELNGERVEIAYEPGCLRTIYVMRGDEVMFEAHPYHGDALGSDASLRNLQRRNAENRQRERRFSEYTEHTAALAAAGVVPQEAVAQAEVVEGAFRKLPGHKQAALRRRMDELSGRGGDVVPLSRPVEVLPEPQAPRPDLTAMAGLLDDPAEPAAPRRSMRDYL